MTMTPDEELDLSHEMAIEIHGFLPSKIHPDGREIDHVMVPWGDMMVVVRTVLFDRLATFDIDDFTQICLEGIGHRPKPKDPYQE